jgi:hypothetical protein
MTLQISTSRAQTSSYLGTYPLAANGGSVFLPLPIGWGEGRGEGFLVASPGDFEFDIFAKFGIWVLGFLWSLALGPWSFSGAWCL